MKYHFCSWLVEGYGTQLQFKFSYLNEDKGGIPLRISHDRHWENKTYELRRSIFYNAIM